MPKGYGIPNLNGSFKTYDADLATKQFHIMKLVATGTIDFCTAATDLAIGVLNSKPYAAAAKDAEVIVAGECKVKAGGTISAGQFIVADASGQAVAVTLGTTTTNVAVGRALEDAVSGDIFRALILPGFIQV